MNWKNLASLSELILPLCTFVVFFYIINEYRVRINPNLLPYGTDWRDWLEVGRAVETGRWHEYNPTRLPFFPILNALVSKGEKDLTPSAIYISLLCHSLIVFPFYFAGRILFGSIFGFLNCLTLLSSIYFIDISTWSNAYPFFSLLMCSFFCFMIYGLMRKRDSWFLGAGITGGLSVITDYKALPLLLVSIVFVFLLTLLEMGFNRTSKRTILLVVPILLLFVSIHLLPMKFEGPLERVGGVMTDALMAGSIIEERESTIQRVKYHYIRIPIVDIPIRASDNLLRTYGSLRVNWINFFRIISPDRYIVEIQWAFFMFLFSGLLLPLIEKKKEKNGTERKKWIAGVLLFIVVFPYTLICIFVWLDIRYIIPILPLLHLLIFNGAVSLFRAILPDTLKIKKFLLYPLAITAIVLFYMPNLTKTVFYYRNPPQMLSMDLIQTYDITDYINRFIEKGAHILNFTNLPLRLFIDDASTMIVNIGKDRMDTLYKKIEKIGYKENIFLLIDNLDIQDKNIDERYMEMIEEMGGIETETIRIWEYRMTPGIVRFVLKKISNPADRTQYQR